MIRRILRRYPHTVVLATCRRRQNGGAFRANIERQIEILDAAVSAGAALVDIEIETAEAAPRSLDRFRGRTRLIISYHDFDRTAALNRALQRLEKVPADIYKLATMARKPSDSVRMLALPAAHPEKPMVLLVMGELGVPSRVLGLARKSIFVFAAPDSDGAGKRGTPVQPTAPGQLPATVLRNLYRAHKCKASTEVYGVIADPVSHSMSPVIHNKAFQVRRLDAVYLPFLVRPAMLADFFRAVEKLPLAGLSVTLPHKQRVIRHLHAVDALAKQIGAGEYRLSPPGQAVRDQYRCSRHHSAAREKGQARQSFGPGRRQRWGCAGCRLRPARQRVSRDADRTQPGPCPLLGARRGRRSP